MTGYCAAIILHNLGFLADICTKHHHHLFNASQVYTIVKRTLKQNDIQLYVS